MRLDSHSHRLVDFETWRHRARGQDGAGAEDELIKRVVRRAGDGDREALHHLYVRYAGDVQAHVRRIVRDSHDAEDITQHVFAKLMGVLHQYEERRSPFSAWLLRMARNAALDHLRRRRALPFGEIHELHPQAEDHSSETATALMEALETLGDDQRAVLLLRYVMGLSPGEIAERLGKSQASVHGLHHRGTGSLRAALSRLEASPATLAQPRP